MGRDNKKRRAAKARKRDRQARRSNGPSGPRSRPSGEPGWDAGWSPGGRRGPGPTEREQVDALVDACLAARALGEASPVVDELLARLASHEPTLVATAVENHLLGLLPVLWKGGWLPGEVLRQIGRAVSPNGQRVVAAAVAVEQRRWGSDEVHPRWRRHVEGLGLPGDLPLEVWLRSPGLAASFTTPQRWPDVLDLAFSVILALDRLGPLDVLVPPPGTDNGERRIVDLTTHEADPVLQKVRHLLAQAESTTFDAEAEAFTAKAQELMARHAIDAAVVWDRADRAERPSTIRLPLDDPYADAKGLLLTVVGDASQCRTVIYTPYSFAAVVGFESDLVWCETLFTSLLVQAQRELASAGAGSRPGSRQRSRSFRSSFLVSFAHRIGDRLDEINASVRAERAAESVAGDHDGGSGGTDRNPRPEPVTGTGLVPLLADRRAAVDDAVDAQFGALSPGSVRGGTDWSGWTAGRAAADRADLARGHLSSA